MRVTLPKPLHGWREFFGEVGIIVLGVLIALGAGQVVEDVNTRRQSDSALAAIRVQLEHAAGVYEERVAIQPCLDRRLKQLDAILREARGSRRLPQIGEIGRAPNRPVPQSAWQMASQNGQLMHFGARDQDALSTHYSQAADFQRQVEEENAMWSELGVLTNAPGPIDGALLATPLATLGRLHFRDYFNGLNAAQQVANLRQMGIRTDYSVVMNEGDKPGRAAMLERIRARAICQPLLVDGKPFDRPV